MLERRRRGIDDPSQSAGLATERPGEDRRGQDRPAPILSRLAGAFRLRRDGPAPPPRPAEIAPAPAAADDEFERRVAKILERQPTIVAGRINFLGLDKIRDHFGADWPRLESRAEQITRHAIERHLTDRDVYSPCGDLQYVIVFGELAEEAGQLKCAAIAAEITERLIGSQGEAPPLQIRTAVKRVDGSLQFREICAAMDIAAAHFGAEAASAERSVPRPARAAFPPAAESTALADEALTLVYRPVWDTKRDAVATFLCAPQAPLAPARRDAAELYRYDVAVLTRVVNDLRTLAAARRRLLLGAQIHLETLMRNRGRHDLIKLCRALPPDQDRLLVFDVVATEDEPPQPRLLELLSYLKPYARAVILHVPITRVKFLSAPESGAAMAGTELPSAEVPETQAIAVINQFVKGAAHCSLPTYIAGIHSTSLASAAVAAGVDYISGDVIEPANPSFGEPRRFKTIDLYARRPA